jgi:UDP:flavonoid glycosyltransferase YjiC (YdhE family)
MEQYFQCDRFVLGSSAHFSQPAKDYSHAVQTGFWFYEDPDWLNWQPDAKLLRFMEQDPKPLVLSFSSQPLEDSRSVVEVHVRAAAKLGRPILIQQGWADFNEKHLPDDCDRSQVMFTGFMPQDWLFSRASALIHHGGIGTTARALRNGCPMLVEPYGNDQFFNAKQIVFHKVGAAMHPMRLQADEVAGVLQNKVVLPSLLCQCIRNYKILMTE